MLDIEARLLRGRSIIPDLQQEGLFPKELVLVTHRSIRGIEDLLPRSPEFEKPLSSASVAHIEQSWKTC